MTNFLPRVLLCVHLAEGMLAYVWIWLIGLLGEGIPIVRAVQTGSIRRYIWFYVYLAAVLLRDALLFAVYFEWPKLYGIFYWGSESLVVLLGCALVWEVYRTAFARYPGAARVAQAVLLLLFTFTLSRIGVKAWNSPNWVPQRTTLETELDLRVVQAALLAALIVLFAYYAIPLGRNLKGIVYGYGLFLASSLVNLSLRGHLGERFQPLWQYLQPGCYMVVLGVWCWTLWNYSPVPVPEVEPALESDYEMLVQGMRGKLSAARHRLLRGTRV